MFALDLDVEQRESLERAMVTVKLMTEDERLALIEHAVATSIHYARNHKDQVLTDWAASLLGTLRLHGSDSFRKAMSGLPRVQRPRALRSH